MSDQPGQDDYRAVTPYLIVHDVPRLLKFLADAFGARERLRVPREDGSIAHAEVWLGDSVVMMGEPAGESGPMPGAIFLRVQDSDAAYRQALLAGGTSVREPESFPHGERYGGVKDPCGNLWWPAMRVR